MSSAVIANIKHFFILLISSNYFFNFQIYSLIEAVSSLNGNNSVRLKNFDFSYRK